jgi:hypothetical protein
MATRRKFTSDTAKRFNIHIAVEVAHRLGSTDLERDAENLMNGGWDKLSPKQWQVITPYLESLSVESWAADDDDVQLCPVCEHCVLVRESENVWVCSGALYESERVTQSADPGGEEWAALQTTRKRIWPLAEQPEFLQRMWREHCGGSRVYSPASGDPKRHDFLDLIPSQLTWALTFDEVVARMKSLYREARYSALNSTVRPTHIRKALDQLRLAGTVRVVMGADGVARFQRVQKAAA